MKVSLVFILPFAFTTVAAQADVWTCKEIYDVRQEVLRARTTVVIEELEDITDEVPPGEFDSAMRVKVTISSTLRGRTTVEREFETRAEMYDVRYSIEDSYEKVKFYNYLDEADEAGIEFEDSRGRVKDLRLSCQWEEAKI